MKIVPKYFLASLMALAMSAGFVARAFDCSDGTGLTVLMHFVQTTGYDSEGGLLQGSDGRLYGTTWDGGVLGGGTGVLFRMDLDGTNYTVLRNFSAYGDANGAHPNGGLVQDAGGALYGTTQLGGSGGKGTVFKLNPDGTGFTVLKDFDSTSGSNPNGGLLQGADGALYGTTSHEFSSEYGTVFKLNPDGTGFTVLYHFDVSNPYPNGELVQGADGALYGTTSGSPAIVENGSVFKLNPDGTGFTVLHDFDNTNGSNSFAGLMQGADGALYGTTYLGGTSNAGTVFKLDPDGTGFSVLQNFDYTTTGGYLRDGLVQGAGGALYGTSEYGGSGDGGTMFKLNPDGTGFAVLQSFDNATAGATPQGKLVHGADGALYGTTFPGADSGLGTIFKVCVPSYEGCQPSWVPTFGQDLNGGVSALAAFDDGSGPALYVAGDFTSAGGVPAKGVARWDGTTWSALGDGFEYGVRTLAVLDSGNGPRLHAGGLLINPDFTFIAYEAKWEGGAWQSGGAPDVVGSLSVADVGSGPQIYAATDYPYDDLWTSNGSGTFHPMGLELKMNGYPNSGRPLVAAAFDDGTGPALYVGGEFNTQGPDFFYVPQNFIAKGLSGDSLEGGMDNVVRCLTVFDDGSGPALYAAGSFIRAGNVTANRIAKWDGQHWSTLGTGMNDEILALASFDDGSGPALYAAGSFTTAGGVAVNRIAKWDGTTWSALGTGMSGYVSALATFDDGNGPALLAGGAFANPPGSADSYLAKWAGCPATSPAAWTDLGHALAGTAGKVPLLTGTGSLTPGSGTHFELSNAKVGSAASLVASLTLLDAPFKGGVLVPKPDLLFPPLPVSASGTLGLSFHWPAIAPAGVKLYVQYWVADAGGPHGFSASNGLQVIGQ